MAKNDLKIKELMAKVAVQKEQLGLKPKCVLKTNGIFKYHAKDDDSYFNLNTVKNSQVLVKALAFLLKEVASVTEASKLLELDVPEFSHNGYSFQDYVDDFKSRLAVLKYEERKAHLELTEAKLSQLVSEETRTEMELDKIEKLL